MLFLLLCICLLFNTSLVSLQPGQELVAINDSLLKELERTSPAEQYFLYEELIDQNLYYNREEALKYAQLYLDHGIRYQKPIDMGRGYNSFGRIADYNNEYSKALEYYQIADSFFRLVDDKYLQMVVKRNIALAYGYMNRSNEQMQAYNESLEIAKALNDTMYVAKIHSEIANVYKTWGAYTEALDYYYDALTHAEVVNDSIQIANIYYSIGGLFREQDNYDKALEFYTLVIEKSSIPRTIANTYVAIAATYNQMNKPDTALFFLDNADSIYVGINDKIGFLYSSLNAASAQRQLNNYALSKEFASKAIQLGKETEHLYGEIAGYISLASTEIKSGNIDTSIILLSKALEISDERNFISLKSKSLEQLEKAYLKKNDYQNAHYYGKLYFELKDSIDEINEERHLQDIYARHKAAKYKAENITLRKDNRIRRLKNIMQLSAFAIVILIIGFYALYVIQRKKKANEILVEKNQFAELQRNELLEINETKDKFFSIISHDLRNPMGNIENFAELLLKNFDSYPSEKIRNFISIIHQSSATASALLVNLLEWSRLQRGAINHEPEEVSLKVVFMQVESLFNSIFEVKNVTLEMDEENNLKVFADKNMLITVLRNLVSNAVKFTPYGGSVKVYTALLANGMVEIFVEDNGRGMDVEQRENLFSSRVESTKGTNNESGTGIGLLLVKEFVELNKGTLHIQSEIGLGSTFSFTVPGVS